jgi:hypothetical protein
MLLLQHVYSTHITIPRQPFPGDSVNIPFENLIALKRALNFFCDMKKSIDYLK